MYQRNWSIPTTPTMNLSYLKPLAKLAVLSFAVASCSTKHHVAKVDAEVYSILKEAEASVFKRSSDFSIDTPESGRSRDEVTNEVLYKKSNQSGNVTLSIKESIDFAIKNSPEYQSEKESLYLTALGLSDTRIPFRVNGRSDVDASLSREADGDQRVNAGLQNSLSTIFRGGGSLSLSLANDLLKYFSGRSDKSIGSIVSFNISQPLLRGFGSEIAAEGLTQSYRNVVYEIRDYAVFQQTFSREIVIDYLSLLQSKEQIENEKTNLDSRRQNYEYLKARSIDRASPEEVADAKQGVLQAETRFINTESGFATQLDTFKIRIGMPAGVTLSLKTSELDDVVSAGAIPFKLSEKRAYAEALQNRASLLNDIDRFEDSRRDVLIAADALKTELNLVSNASLLNSGDRWERLNFNDISATVGLELDLPVNKKRERNNYRRALIRFDANARSLGQTHDRLKNLVSLRFRQLDQFRQNYDIQLGALALAERRVEGNELRLKAGTVIFRRLSESQDALIGAQNAVTTALVNYQESRLRLYEELGILDVEKSNFWLK